MSSLICLKWTFKKILTKKQLGVIFEGLGVLAKIHLRDTKLSLLLDILLPGGRKARIGPLGQ